MDKDARNENTECHADDVVYQIRMSRLDSCYQCYQVLRHISQDETKWHSPSQRLNESLGITFHNYSPQTPN
jgi:hypothetical protein